jgi:nicotinamidase-related amidase
MNDKRNAVIVVDLQNDYFPGGRWTLSNIESASANAAKVIAAARESGDLLVHIRHEFESDAAPFFTPGSDGAKTHESVKALNNEDVMVKHQVNSFRDTKLKNLLDDNKIENVIVCGAMSNMCVDAVTRAAHDYGFKVSVVHDACASRELEFNGVQVPAEQVHAAFMSSLGFAYATMITTQEFVTSRKASLSRAH